MMSKEVKDSCSYNSYGPLKKKKVMKCHSQPFVMPRFKLAEQFIKFCGKFQQSKSVDSTEPEPVDFTLDESKVILKEIAQKLDCIVQTRDLSLLTKVSEDGTIEKRERQTFLLQWAEELQPQADEVGISTQAGVSSPCENRPEDNNEQFYKPTHEEEKNTKARY